MGIVIFKAREPDQIEILRAVCSASLRSASCPSMPRSTFFRLVRQGKQRGALKDKAHDQFVVQLPWPTLPSMKISPPEARQKAIDDAQHGRFAAPARSDDADKFAVAHGEIDVL